MAQRPSNIVLAGAAAGTMGACEALPHAKPHKPFVENPEDLSATLQKASTQVSCRGGLALLGSTTDAFVASAPQENLGLL